MNKGNKYREQSNISKCNFFFKYISKGGNDFSVYVSLKHKVNLEGFNSRDSS